MPDVYTNILEVLAASDVAIFVRESLWVYPVLETLHVIGLALIFGPIFIFDLRLLGVTPGLPLDLLTRHILPWVWGGFALNMTSGLLMFVSDAVDFASNPALSAKLALLALAGLNAAYFQMQIYPQSASWNSSADIPVRARFTAALSIFVWLGVITAGRLMAYVA